VVFWGGVLLRILDRYILREVLVSWHAVTGVLLAILITNRLARVLERAAESLTAAFDGAPRFGRPGGAGRGPVAELHGPCAFPARARAHSEMALPARRTGLHCIARGLRAMVAA
jgi:hypothetical protein